MRYTNRKLIDILLTLIKEREKRDIPEFDDKDYYGNPTYTDRIEPGLWVKWTKYDKEIVLEATILLIGKYDHATLNKRIPQTGPNYYYAKEYTGTGNGFYAEISPEGKIINFEWD